MQPDSLVTITSLFQKALTLQQQKKFDEAISTYKTIINENPDLGPDVIADISYNISLSYFLNKNSFQSYVYNQKAIELSPNHSQALDLAQKIKTQFQVRSIPHDITFTENYKKSGLHQISFEIFFVFALIFLFFILKSSLLKIIEKKTLDQETTEANEFKTEPLQNESFLKSLSLKKGIQILCVFLFSTLAAINYKIEMTPRALIAIEQSGLQTAAGENQGLLTELPGGSLIYILRFENVDQITYAQVKYPGGLSGWVKKSDLEIIKMPND